MYALEESILALELKNVNVLLTGLQEQPEEMLKKIKVIPNLIDETNIFKNFDDCLTWLATKKQIDLS